MYRNEYIRSSSGIINFLNLVMFGSNDVAKCMFDCKLKFKLAGHLPPFHCNAIIPKSGIQDARKYGPYRWREPEEACGGFPPFFRVSDKHNFIACVVLFFRFRYRWISLWTWAPVCLPYIFCVMALNILFF